MPNEVCSVCMRIIITKFKFRGVEEDSVNINFIIYWTESSSTPLSIKISNENRYVHRKPIQWAYSANSNQQPCT